MSLPVGAWNATAWDESVWGLVTEHIGGSPGHIIQFASREMHILPRQIVQLDRTTRAARKR